MHPNVGEAAHVLVQRGLRGAIRRSEGGFVSSRRPGAARRSIAREEGEPTPQTLPPSPPHVAAGEAGGGGGRAAKVKRPGKEGEKRGAGKMEPRWRQIISLPLLHCKLPSKSHFSRYEGFAG